MSSLNIAILGDSPVERAAAAASFGKKSSLDDLGFYHTVFQGKIVTAIDPAGYPAKLSCLTQTLALADFALVLAPQLSAGLGELIVALDLTGIPAVFVTPLDLSPILSQTGLKESAFYVSLDEAKAALLQKESPVREGTPLAYLDHCFEVKGVGTVALGIVKRGTISVHDTLNAFPTEGSIEVKSIQKNDDDVKSASSGDRLGLSIKGMKAQDVSRGIVLAHDGVQVGKEFLCSIRLSGLAKTSLENGDVLHASCGLQFEPVKIESSSAISPGKAGEAKLVFEKPFAIPNGEKLILCDLNAKGLRVLATAAFR